MKSKKVVITIAAVIIIASIAAGLLWYEIAGSKLYTYQISAAEKTYSITVSTNWNSAPKVYLSNSSLTDLKYISVDFLGSCRKTVTFRITFPSDLLQGNITLVWKYYEQNPNRYTVSNDGTNISVEMTFTHIAVDEHFEIHGTKGAW
jgi:hypothetical protein